LQAKRLAGAAGPDRAEKSLGLGIWNSCSPAKSFCRLGASLVDDALAAKAKHQKIARIVRNERFGQFAFSEQIKGRRRQRKWGGGGGGGGDQSHDWVVFQRLHYCGLLRYSRLLFLDLFSSLRRSIANPILESGNGNGIPWNLRAASGFLLLSSWDFIQAVSFCYNLSSF
jgi:hypothetical protein